MTVAVVLAATRWWFIDAVVDRVKWQVEDLFGGADNTSWDKIPTGEWLAPKRKSLKPEPKKRGAQR